MSRQHGWTLSQGANKQRGTCSSCYEAHQLHLKDGTVHLHGPRKNPCPGSHKPPLPSSASSVVPSSAPPSSAFNQSHNSTQILPLSSNSLPLSCQPNTPNLVDLSSPSTPLALQTAAHGSSPTIAPFCHPTNTAPIIKHIPKSARSASCIALSDILNVITRSMDDVTSWTNLFSFGFNILRKPSRSGKRHNLTNIIKKRIDDCSQGSVSNQDDLDHNDTSRKRRPDAAASLSAAVTAKIEDGNIKAALRIICSEDKPAPDNIETLSALMDKHPVSTSGGHVSSLVSSQAISFQASEEDVLGAIRSFPAGSSGGPDGIRPQHIADLVKCKENGRTLLSALTKFVNCLLEGKCPSAVKPILFGGNLIALSKKSGGIRPIAVGYTLRRLAAKCANAFASARLATYLYPRQLGIAVSGGSEAAVHAARRFIDSMPAGHAVVKLDFSNAFNSLHRNTMLNAVLQHIPEIYKFCLLSYGEPSILKFNNNSIISQKGIQQGDPLGPLLFCLAVHPIQTFFNFLCSKSRQDRKSVV